MIKDLNERARQILKLVVDAYVDTGEPVGSVAISQKLGMKLSPATIRSAMAELEDRGLLYAPHTSAGRLPTDTGLTVFVDGLLELDDLSTSERQKIEQNLETARGKSVTDVMEQTSHFLSGLSSCAGLVFAPKSEDPIKQIEFVHLAPGRALGVLVTNSGIVENRLIDIPPEVTATALARAASDLNSRISDQTL
jgi:heat-inducible transcriptional repressor